MGEEGLKISYEGCFRGGAVRILCFVFSPIKVDGLNFDRSIMGFG